MQNRYRLYLAAIALAAFALAIAAIGASGTSDAEDPANSCGNGLTWTYENNTCTLKIELTDSTKDGKMADYTDESEQPWRGFRGQIWTLDIDDRVTSIGDYAFNGCNLLTSLTIPGSVTAIGDYAFAGCSDLASLTIPGSVTAIGDYAFYKCQGLTGTLTIPGSVTTIGHHAFEECSGLTGTLTIPGSVTSIGDHVFDGCSKLTGFAVDPANISYASDSQGILYDKDMTTLLQCPGGKSGEITIPGSVKTIGYGSFDGCSKLTGFAVEDGNLSYASDQGILYSKDMTILLQCPVGKTGGITIPGTVEIIDDYAFNGCRRLASLTFSEGSKLTTIGEYAFNGCSGLKGALTIPATVKTIGEYAFYGCFGLTSLTFSGGSKLTTIGEYAFNGCRGLTDTLTIPATVKTIGYGSFGGCSKLTGFAVEDGNLSYVSDQGILYNMGKTILLQCPGGKTDEISIPATVETIGDYAFYGYKSTGTLTIPGSVTYIGDYAFENCGFTGTLTIPGSVTYIGDYAFYNCKFTGTLTIPGSVTYIGDYAFYNCKFTGTLTIGEKVTYIGDYAFQVCEFTGTLTIPGTVTYIGDYAFSGSKFTGDLTIPDSVTYIGDHPFWGSKFTGDLTIPDSVTYIGGYAFANCGFTGTLTIPGSVTSIESGAFQSCGFTGNLAIPDSVTYIGALSFYDCKGFTGNLAIPDSVTSIDNGAFNGCSNLKGTLTIGEKVTYIGNNAFKGCGFTGDLTIPGSVTYIGDRAFEGCWDLTGTLTILDTVTYIGDYAFSNCGFTGTLTIGKNVTYIGSFAFNGCIFTGTVTIPGSVTYIDCYAFAGAKLQRIVFPESVETIGDSAFDSTFHDYDDKWVKVDATAENLRGKAWVGKANEYYTKLYRSFEITFDANGGSFQTGDGEKILYTDPDRKLSEDPGAPSKTGHDFTGWFVSPVEVFVREKQFTEDTTYFANYKPKTMDVSFIPNGGKFDPDTFQRDPDNDEFRIKEVTYGEPYGDLPVVVREGMHSFWALYDKDEDVWIPIDKDTTVTMEGYHQLTALWRDDEYRVTVTVENGATDLYKDGEVYNVRYHASLNIPILPDEGYEPPKERSGVSVRIGGAPYDGFSYTVDGSLGQALVSIPEGVIEGPVEVTVGCILRILTVSVDTSDPGIASVEYRIGEGGFVTYTAPFNVSYGSKLTLRAVVEDGYEFKEWQPSGETDVQLVIGIVTGDMKLAPKAAKLLPEPPGPTPAPKPKPPVITVTVTFESVGGGHTSEESVKVPLNSKVAVYGSTLVIGSGNATVKAIPDAGYAFSEWIVPDGNLLSDSEIKAVFVKVTVTEISVWTEPYKLDYAEGERFDPAGLAISVRYSDGSEVHVDYEGNESRFSFDPSLDTPLKASDDKVIVKYGGMSAVQEITVSESDSPIWWVLVLIAILALVAFLIFILLKRRRDAEATVG